MRNFIRFASTIVVGGFIAGACSGSDGTPSASQTGGSSGSSGSLAGSGGASGDGAGGTAVSSSTAGTSTSSGSGGAGGNGVAGSTGGAGKGAGGDGVAGSTGGAGDGAGGDGVAGSGGGSGGDGGLADPLGCVKDDDCVVAYAHSSKGCCFRGCGSAFSKNYVTSDPCITTSANGSVPTSCDTGCLACPASQCQDVYGAVCVKGQCTSVTQYGPCATDDDCVVAVDYASEQGGCCSCPEIASKLLLANDRCVVLKGQPKPDGCMPTPAGVCNSLGCPAQCPSPTMLKCDKGNCTGTP